jgi:catechol O-methyltransferase
MGIMEAIGRRFPFARWSVIRMGFGARKLLKDWQVGDGREAALQRHVLANVRRGDLDGAIRAIDRFAYSESFLMNVGDEKGAILDAAVVRAKPRLLLELGTYCGYSALRTLRVAPPEGRLVTVEFSADNAAIARSIFEHAGVAERVAIVHGSLGDGGRTAGTLRDAHGFAPGSLDFAFIDHAKDAYLPDLQLILREQWLRPGAVVVADNVRIPGAPEYHAFMKANEGTLFRTREHPAHVEYQTLLKDLVLESEFLGHSTTTSPAVPSWPDPQE